VSRKGCHRPTHEGDGALFLCGFANVTRGNLSAIQVTRGIGPTCHQGVGTSVAGLNRIKKSKGERVKPDEKKLLGRTRQRIQGHNHETTKGKVQHRPQPLRRGTMRSSSASNNRPSGVDRRSAKKTLPPTIDSWAAGTVGEKR